MLNSVLGTSFVPFLQPPLQGGYHFPQLTEKETVSPREGTFPHPRNSARGCPGSALASTLPLGADSHRGPCPERTGTGGIRPSTGHFTCVTHILWLRADG